MDFVDYLVVHISPLPWTVKGVGFAFIAFLVFRAIGQFFSLRWIRALTSLVMALVVALIMARFGQDIAAYLTNLSVQETNNSSNN
ncbi:MAG: hypothetical protein AAF423_14085 [Pseudomonadota bacterium]